MNYSGFLLEELEILKKFVMLQDECTIDSNDTFDYSKVLKHFKYMH